MGGCGWARVVNDLQSLLNPTWKNRNRLAHYCKENHVMMWDFLMVVTIFTQHEARNMLNVYINIVL